MNEVAWDERVGAEAGIGDFIPAAPGWSVVEFTDPKKVDADCPSKFVQPLVGWLRVRSAPDEVGWTPAIFEDSIVRPAGSSSIVRGILVRPTQMPDTTQGEPR